MENNTELNNYLEPARQDGKVNCSEGLEALNQDVLDIEYIDIKDLYRKQYRALRYEGLNFVLDEELFKRLELKKPFDRKTYDWNFEQIDELFEDTEIESNAIKYFLEPPKDSSYQDLEDSIITDPNTTVAAMTLLIDRYEEKILHTHNKTSLLFSNEEESAIFIGLELMNIINSKKQSDFTKELMRKAKGVIIRHNIGLVKSRAAHNCKVDRARVFEDLEQEGQWGVLIAIDKFDIDKDYKFSTYATYWIDQKIKRFLGYDQVIKFPEYINTRLGKFRRKFKEIEQIRGESPTYEEVVEHFVENDEDMFTADEIRDLIKKKRLSSLDKTIDTDDGDGDTLESFVKSDFKVEEVAEHRGVEELWDDVAKQANLTDREKMVLEMRVGKIPSNETNRTTHTLREIAEKEELSRERIRQIQAVARRKVKKVTGRKFY